MKSKAYLWWEFSAFITGAIGAVTTALSVSVPHSNNGLVYTVGGVTEGGVPIVYEGAFQTGLSLLVLSYFISIVLILWKIVEKGNE